MMVIEKIKVSIAFFTIIPVKTDKKENIFEDLADSTPILPLIGVFIGLMSGFIALILSKFLSKYITGILTLGTILLITGLHHTDGLLDFGDGLMCVGSPQRKIDAMHDRQVGVGGLVLALTVLLATALTIAELITHEIIRYLIVSEVSAKLAIIFGAWIGKPVGSGIGQKFIEAVQRKRKNLRFFSSLIISITVSFLMLKLVGIGGIIAGLISSLIIVMISTRHFKGLTGDVLGAMNEIARMSSLMIMMVISK